MHSHATYLHTYIHAYRQNELLIVCGVNTYILKYRCNTYTNLGVFVFLLYVAFKMQSFLAIDVAVVLVEAAAVVFTDTTVGF